MTNPRCWNAPGCYHQQGALKCNCPTPAARSGFGFTHNYGRSEPVRQPNPTRDMSEESKPAKYTRTGTKSAETSETIPDRVQPAESGAREWFALRNTRTNQLTITFSTQKELDEHFNYHYWNNQDSRERVHVIEKSAYDALKAEANAAHEYANACGVQIENLKAERDHYHQAYADENAKWIEETDQLRRELSEAKALFVERTEQKNIAEDERDAARADAAEWKALSEEQRQNENALSVERDRFQKALERIAAWAEEPVVIAREALGEGKGDT